jgi:hypothetical protein
MCPACFLSPAVRQVKMPAGQLALMKSAYRMPIKSSRSLSRDSARYQPISGNTSAFVSLSSSP